MHIGFGIRTDDIEWNKDRNKVMMEIIFEKCPIITQDFIDNLGNMDGCETDDEKYDWFVENYQGVNGWAEGFDALLPDMINEAEHLPMETFEYENGILNVPLDLPYDDYAKKNMLTQVDIQNIIRKYINRLTNFEIPIDFYRIDSEDF